MKIGMCRTSKYPITSVYRKAMNQVKCSCYWSGAGTLRTEGKLLVQVRTEGFDHFHLVFIWLEGDMFSFYPNFIFKCKRILVISEIPLKEKDDTLDLHV
jgi:hypothetical protein